MRWEIHASFKCVSRGRPGEPAQIKCKCTGSTNIRMGEKMKGEIDIHIKDKHGNEIKQVWTWYSMHAIGVVITPRINHVKDNYIKTLIIFCQFPV